MKRLPAAVLLACSALQFLAPTALGFAVPAEQSAIGIQRSAMIFAWTVLSILMVAVCVYLLIREVNYAGIIWPLIATVLLQILTLVTDRQQWWWVSFGLVAAMSGLLWRTFYILVKHRQQISLLGTWLVTTPVAIYAGWVSVTMLTRVADALWNAGLPKSGTLATAWQSVIIILIVLAAGFGIEASRAHIAYAASVTWASIHVSISAGRSDNGILTSIALFATLIILALFFIERAMFRGPRARPVSR